MLIRGVLRSLITSPIRTPSPSIYSFFSSSFSPSSATQSAAGIVAAGAATDFAEDGLLLDDIPTSAAPAPAPAAVAASTIPSVLQPGVVVYDGVCHLCHNGVKWVMKVDKDKKIKFCCLQSQAAEPYMRLCGVDREDVLRRFLFIEGPGLYHQGSTGVKWVMKVDKDKKIKFCCLQSQAAEPYMRLCGVDREDVLRRFLFIEGPGLYHQGSTAALKVLSYLPLPYSALSTLLIVPTPLRDAVYDYIAKRRYDWFGKEEDCLVLKEKELLERFIDREEIFGRTKSDL